jgi:hypothetical protein
MRVFLKFSKHLCRCESPPFGTVKILIEANKDCILSFSDDILVGIIKIQMITIHCVHNLLHSSYRLAN